MRLFIILFLFVSLVSSCVCFAVETSERPMMTINSALLQTHKTQQVIEAKRTIYQAFSLLGIDVEFRYRPDKRAIHEANSGIVDGEFARVKHITDDYPNVIVVPESLAEVEMVEFAIKAEKPANQVSFSDQQRRVGYMLGWKNSGDMLASHPHKVAMSDHIKLFNVLFHDRIDTVLYTKKAGIEILKKQNRQLKTIISKPLQAYSVYLVMHKKHAELVPKLAAKIKEVKRRSQK